MATNKSKISQPEAINPSPQAPAKLALKWRMLISVVILFHLAAVIAAPMAVYPASELQMKTADMLRPYICAAYLDHGYRFFAPQPSPGHIIRYTLEMPDGKPVTGQFPDKQAQWPRLLYHRHFMLTEKLAQILPSIPLKDLPKDAPPLERDQLKFRWSVFDATVGGYAQHLLDTTGAKKVTLTFVSHQMPEMDDIAHNRALDDKRFFQTLWTGTYEAAKL